ncbi:MAG: molybdenum cofactor biosynthesis protein MoaE [Acidobacteria bacterium]|nr:molybdenum cofactor biosynthesis protein MoaE [Acidobacteriota bacterium]
MGRYTERVKTPLLAIGRGPLDLEQLIAALAADPSTSSGRDGAVVTFLGLVRNHNVGRSVRHLEYEAYVPLALKTFERIAAEIGERWPSARLALHHRIGRLEIGEASVVIAVSAAHRAEAFEACRYAIDTLKRTVPVWKKEHFEDGEIWVGLQGG